MKKALMIAGKILLLGNLCLVLAFCVATQSSKAKENENDPQYHYQKAVVALKYGFEDEAIKHLDQAISLSLKGQAFTFGISFLTIPF